MKAGNFVQGKEVKSQAQKHPTLPPVLARTACAVSLQKQKLSYQQQDYGTELGADALFLVQVKDGNLTLILKG